MVYTKQEARSCRTLDRGSFFRVSGSVREGVRVWVGRSQQPRTFGRKLFQDLLEHFRGKRVEIGSSFSDPKPDSVGAWLVEEGKVKGGNPAVYLTAILAEEGYVEKVKRGWIRFVDLSRGAKPEGSGIRENVEDLRGRLLARISELDQVRLAAAERALEAALQEEDLESPFESLRGDPDFILPSARRKSVRSFEPIRIEGRPLSRDIIEDRR